MTRAGRSRTSSRCSAAMRLGARWRLSWRELRWSVETVVVAEPLPMALPAPIGYFASAASVSTSGTQLGSVGELEPICRTNPATRKTTANFARRDCLSLSRKGGQLQVLRARAYGGCPLCALSWSRRVWACSREPRLDHVATLANEWFVLNGDHRFLACVRPNGVKCGSHGATASAIASAIGCRASCHRARSSA